jgi:hypothetical protein
MRPAGARIDEDSMFLNRVTRASSLLLVVALLMISALGSACDARCALGPTGHHHEGALHHCTGSSDAQYGWNLSHVHAACALDHVWAAGEQPSAHFDISDWHGFATATLRKVNASDRGTVMGLRPPIHRVSLPLRI